MKKMTDYTKEDFDENSTYLPYKVALPNSLVAIIERYVALCEEPPNSPFIEFETPIEITYRYGGYHGTRSLSEPTPVWVNLEALLKGVFVNRLLKDKKAFYDYSTNAGIPIEFSSYDAPPACRDAGDNTPFYYWSAGDRQNCSCGLELASKILVECVEKMKTDLAEMPASKTKKADALLQDLEAFDISELNPGRFNAHVKDWLQKVKAGEAQEGETAVAGNSTTGGHVKAVRVRKGSARTK